jgi:hydrogenase-4 component F
MGILVLGAAVGGAGLFGSLLHMLNNGFTKGVLFLSAANIHRALPAKSPRT